MTEFVWLADRRQITVPAKRIALPMNRRDIADYLGLTLKTVSRAISAYQRKGYLKVAGPMPLWAARNCPV